MKYIFDSLLYFLNDITLWIILLTVVVFIISILVSGKVFAYLHPTVSKSQINFKKSKNNYFNIRKITNSSLYYFHNSILKIDFLNKFKQRYKITGLSSDRINNILFILFAAFVFLFIFSIVNNSLNVFFTYSVVLIILNELYLTAQKKLLEKGFNKSAYKIYKFLHNQTSTGTPLSDAIKNLYLVINDNSIKKIFKKFSARYELTNDIDITIDELLNTYNIVEVDILCTAIKQGVLVGNNDNTFKNQEDKMFSKYINHIKAETKSNSVKYFMISFCFASVIAIMIIAPMLYELGDNINEIFIK